MIETVAIFIILVLLLTACAQGDECGQRIPYFKYDFALTQIVRNLDVVRNAWVIETNRKAYVAVMLHQSATVPKSVKQQIIDAVRTCDTKISEVYISTSKPFIHQCQQYSRRSKSGDSLEPYAKQLEMVVNNIQSSKS